MHKPCRYCIIDISIHHSNDLCYRFYGRALESKWLIKLQIFHPISWNLNFRFGFFLIFLPQITVEETDIDFDIIQFNESYTRDFTVANNCHLPVRFEFRAKEENEKKEKKICESWLHVEPTHGELITGDSLSIRFKIFIDVHTAWRMHRKQKVSNKKNPLDILVLHVENGRDIFITILGEFRPSCFGFSVETLARLPQPVYELGLEKLLQIVSIVLHQSKSVSVNDSNSWIHFKCILLQESDLKSSYSSSVYKVLNIPREIYQLVDYLNRNGMRTPNLFTMERKYKSNPFINDIRDWLSLWSSTDFRKYNSDIFPIQRMKLLHKSDVWANAKVKLILEKINFLSWKSIYCRWSLTYAIGIATRAIGQSNGRRVPVCRVIRQMLWNHQNFVGTEKEYIPVYLHVLKWIAETQRAQSTWCSQTW